MDQEPMERRDTGDVPRMAPANGVILKWVLGLLAAAVIGAFGWVSAWGQQGAEVSSHERRISKIEERQDDGVKEVSAMKARQQMLISSLNEMKRDIKTLLKRGNGRRHR